MKTRMQPIDNVWQKLPRVVRDLVACSCGKQVRLEMEGRETELDRTILEADQGPADPPGPQRGRPRHRDPRGAPRRRQARARASCCCAPSTRAARSTSRSPTTARGIDPAQVGRQGRRARAWSPPTQLGPDERARDRAPDLPARASPPPAAVTNVSGRGVGMDVVKTNIEKIGGSDRRPDPGRPRHHVPHQDPADPGHHPGADRRAAPATATPSPRSACSSWSASRASGPQGASRTSAARRSTGCAATCSRWCDLDAALGVGPGVPDDRATVYILVLAGRGPAVRPRRRRRRRHRGDRRQAAGQAAQGHPRPTPARRSSATAGSRSSSTSSALAQQSGVVSASREHAHLAERPRAAAPAASRPSRCCWSASASGRRMAVPLALVTRLEEFPMPAVERVGHRRGRAVPRRRSCRWSASRTSWAPPATRRARGACRSSSTATAAAASAWSSTRSSTSSRRSSSRATRRARRCSARPSCRGTSPSCSTSAPAILARGPALLRRARRGRARPERSPRVERDPAVHTFTLDGDLFGVEVEAVQEVLRTRR